MRYIISIICCLMLFGCAIDPLGRNAIRNTPIAINNNTKQISVIKFIDTIEVGKEVGKNYTGKACVSRGKSKWSASTKLINNMSDMVRIKLDKQGYSLVGKASSPFNDEYSKNAELLLGGKLVDAELNICSSVKGDKGELYIKVDWEIYDNKLGKVIYTTSTEGTSSIKEFDILGQMKLFERAFDMSIDNLLADNSFFSILAKK